MLHSPCALVAGALALLLPSLTLAGDDADPLPAAPLDPGFEEGAVGESPGGWIVRQATTDAGYRVFLTDEDPREGKRCVRIDQEGEGAAGVSRFGNVMQTVDATAYRGRRVRFRASVRTALPGGASRAQLWFRVDRAGNGSGFFENMANRPITVGEWHEFEIVGEVASDAVDINFGMMLFGPGTAWLDAVSVEIFGAYTERSEPARRVTERGLENLVAFTRLLGYVRHFHPSDEAADTDWESFAIRGVGEVEGAADAGELASTLHHLFAPIAPSVRIARSDDPPEDDAGEAGADHSGAWITAWRHRGVGLSDARSIYMSRRVDDRRPLPEVFRLTASPDAPPPGPRPRADLRRPDRPFRADLGGGVRAAIPLGVWADSSGTLPHAPSPTVGPHLDAPRPNGNDRATRLAAVSLAWNVFQHFYPYFDATEVDWPAVLRDALTAAAEDANEREFLDTLRRLVAALEDGHGRVTLGLSAGDHRPPLFWDWIEEGLVVSQVATDGAEGLQPGDEIVAIDGVPAEEALRRCEMLISGATAGWIRYRALADLATGDKGSEIALRVRTAAGEERDVMLARTSPAFGPEALEPIRPERVAQLRPGIYYLDLDRISDRDFRSALSDLVEARGIVFDLRGYPGNVSVLPLAHLIDGPATSAQWHTPFACRPDREGLEFRFSNWEIEPAPPRLEAKVAFLTGSRAISYAETYLGIVEHYRLGEIVGGPTAGTNGNVNPFTLPGGYRVTWTGMKVLKHDGSPHHGVGIHPTVPVARTRAGVAEGRDEVLERALDLVSD